MPLVTTTEMFKRSMKEHYAIGAFNINNMEFIQAITEAANEAKSPVILQVSSSAIKYARMNYRKWDNVKHIREIVKSRNIPRDVYSSKGLWGISLKTKNRLNSEDGKNLKFSIVVTLKELNGVNRIEDFIRNCLLNEWFVNKIDIENRVDIHNIAEEDIHFEE